MRVRATQVGYYGGELREVGEVFDILDDPRKGADGQPVKGTVAAFSKRWMESVDNSAPVTQDVEDMKPETEPPGITTDITNPVSIEEAVMRLDHDNDDHWTKDGLPSMSAIEAIIGDSTITRPDVEAATDGLRRKTD